jgi:hypothetical protein
LCGLGVLAARHASPLRRRDQVCGATPKQEAASIVPRVYSAAPNGGYGVRRIGWFLVGAAATAAALVAVPALRDRLRGDAHDDLPAAVGLDDALEADDDPTDEVELEPEPEPESELTAAHSDEAADELRERIDSGRERLRRKARAGATEAEETGELRIEPDDEPPAAG